MSVSALQDKYSTPYYKRQAAYLTAFAKSLTSSAPSRIAARRKDLSINKPLKYLKLAHPPKKPPTPPPPVYVPPRLLTLLQCQDDEGRWQPLRRTLEALGGYVPRPPHGMDPVRWTTALVLVFLKRHPEYWFATEKAVIIGEQYVADDRLLRTAADSLPPGFADLPGNYNDRLDRDKVLEGRWKESEQTLLQTVGYMGFVVDTNQQAALPVTVAAQGQQHRIGAVFDFALEDESVGAAAAAATAAGGRARGSGSAAGRRPRPGSSSSAALTHDSSGSLGDEASADPNDSSSTTTTTTTTSPARATPDEQAAAMKPVLRPRLPLKAGQPMDAATRQFLQTAIEPTTVYHRSVYDEEVERATERRPFYHEGEEVHVRWRRESRWTVRSFRCCCCCGVGWWVGAAAVGGDCRVATVGTLLSGGGGRRRRRRHQSARCRAVDTSAGSLHVCWCRVVGVVCGGIYGG
jgi:hypothetical protein